MGTVAVVSGFHRPTSPTPPPELPHISASEVRRIADLLAHPALAKHTPGYSTQELSTLTERGEAAFSDPVTITHQNIILEGYALWHFARLQNRPTLTCIIRPMDQEAALLHLLQRNRGSKGISDFVRVLMALELEPWFRDRAKSTRVSADARRVRHVWRKLTGWMSASKWRALPEYLLAMFRR